MRGLKIRLDSDYIVSGKAPLDPEVIIGRQSVRRHAGFVIACASYRVVIKWQAITRNARAIGMLETAKGLSIMESKI